MDCCTYTVPTKKVSSKYYTIHKRRRGVLYDSTCRRQYARAQEAGANNFQGLYTHTHTPLYLILIDHSFYCRSESRAHSASSSPMNYFRRGLSYIPSHTSSATSECWSRVLKAKDHGARRANWFLHSARYFARIQLYCCREPYLMWRERKLRVTLKTR